METTNSTSTEQSMPTQHIEYPQPIPSNQSTKPLEPTLLTTLAKKPKFIILFVAIVTLLFSVLGLLLVAPKKQPGTLTTPMPKVATASATPEPKLSQTSDTDRFQQLEASYSGIVKTVNSLEFADPQLSLPLLDMNLSIEKDR